MPTSALSAGRREGFIRLRAEKEDDGPRGGQARLLEGWVVGLPDKIQDMGVQFKFHGNRNNLCPNYDMGHTYTKNIKRQVLYFIFRRSRTGFNSSVLQMRTLEPQG